MTVVRRKGLAVLVQWLDDDGKLRRGKLPPDVVRDGEVDEDQLAMALPYGEPWEELIELSTTAEDVADELRRRGVWTLEDLAADPGAAQAAFMQAYSRDLTKLRLRGKRGGKQS